MGELNITFGGICVNMHRIVPGVPMRTVLPWATDIRFGQIRIPVPEGGSRQVGYYLFPHIATYRTQMLGSTSTPLFGVHMTVANPKPQPFCFDGNGYFLSDFKKDVEPATDVVFEGNAAAYFDIHGGRVWTEGAEDEMRYTRAVIKTEGTPRVRLTSLPGTFSPVDDEIETDQLFVTNLDLQSATEDSPFDFLLNYLVMKGGIPHELDKLTPGLYGDIVTITTDRLGERIKALGLLIETQGLVSGWRQAVSKGDEPGAPPLRWKKAPEWDLGIAAKLAVDPVPLDPSCSTGNAGHGG